MEDFKWRLVGGGLAFRGWARLLNKHYPFALYQRGTFPTDFH